MAHHIGAGALVAAALLAFATPAAAQQGTWATDPIVGTSEVDVTIGISCPAMTFTCSLIDGYGDTQTSTVTGSGTVLIDELLDEIQFETDSMQDVGAGLQPAYVTMSGTPLAFASIPFAGMPEITNLLIFALSNPALATPGLALLPPGDYPFSGTVDYGSTAEVIGDLELILPDIVVPAQAVSLSGTLRILGDVDMDSFVEYEIVDYTASVTIQFPGNIAGEPVDITVTSDLVANLSGEVAGPVLVPALGDWARIFLALAMAGGAMLVIRSRRGPQPGQR